MQVLEMVRVAIELRLAVALARQGVASSKTIDEIARDALELARVAGRARKRLEKAQSAAADVAKCKEIAAPYGAKVVAQMDLEGCVVALRFPAGSHQSGFRGLLFVS